MAGARRNLSRRRPNRPAARPRSRSLAVRKGRARRSCLRVRSAVPPFAPSGDAAGADDGRQPVRVLNRPHPDSTAPPSRRLPSPRHPDWPARRQHATPLTVAGPSPSGRFGRGPRRTGRVDGRVVRCPARVRSPMGRTSGAAAPRLVRRRRRERTGEWAVSGSGVRSGSGGESGAAVFGRAAGSGDDGSVGAAAETLTTPRAGSFAGFAVGGAGRTDGCGRRRIAGPPAVEPGGPAVFLGLGGRRFRGKNMPPVEVHLGMAVLEAANRVFVEGGAADLQVRRRSKPVQKPRFLALAAPAAMAGDKKRALVPAPIPGKADGGHSLLALGRRL